MGFFLGFAVVPNAQEAATNELETLVVTARKTGENLQQVPASITVLTGIDLTSAGINNFQELTRNVPNVAMSGGIAGAIQGQIGIRGIATLVRNIGVESGVGLYIDGVYQGRPETYNHEFIDIAQVEILRGPQGTLFGKNTIAGAFNITTVRPTNDETRGVFNVEMGNYGGARFQGYVTGPLINDTLAGKFSFGYVMRRGFYKHLSGDTDIDSVSLLSYRTSFYYTSPSNSTFILTADGLYDRSKPVFFQVTDLLGANSPNAIRQETTPHTIDNNRPNYLNRDNYGISLTGEMRAMAGTITLITAYRQSEYQASLDDDQNQIDFVAIDRWGDRNYLWTQELRYNGDMGSDGNYVVGLYYFGQTIRTSRRIALGADSGIPGEPSLTTHGRVRTNNYAIYGNVNYQITDLLTTSLGLRLSNENKNVQFTQGDPNGVYVLIGFPAIDYANTVSDSDFSPTGTLSYKIAPDVMTYARIARGFKSAAFNVDIVSSTAGLAADPENATSYEIGLKSEFLDGRIRVNAALFRTDYDNMQVSQLLGTAITLSNAASATINGAEAEITGFLTSNLRVGFGVGVLDARYDIFENCGIPASLGGGSTDCSGNRIIGAPNWTASLTTEYTRPTPWGEFIVRLDYEFKSPVYYEATNSKRFKSDLRNVFNTRAGLGLGNYEVFVWVKNLTDDTYITYSDDRSAVGALRTTAYGPPRTFGATLSTSF